jgi:hypothetical protein
VSFERLGAVGAIKRAARMTEVEPPQTTNGSSSPNLQMVTDEIPLN